MESVRTESACVIGMPDMELSAAVPGLVVVVVAGAMFVVSIAVLSFLLHALTATSVIRAVIPVIALVRIFLLTVRRDTSVAAAVRIELGRRHAEGTSPLAQTMSHGAANGGRAWYR
jgi:hypothetical protein